MEPVDAESLVSRLERNFWTVWGVFSEAVNRFLRPQVPNNIGSDPNTPDISHAGTNGSSEEDTIIEKCLDLPNSSELLSGESEENKQLLSSSNNKYEEVESTKAEPLHQNKPDYEGMLITRKTNIEKLETPKNDTYEHLKTKSQSHIEDTVCIKVQGNKYDTYTEETMSPVNAEIFKETDQEQDPLQHTERQNFSDNESGIKLIQELGLGKKSDMINMGNSGEEPDGATVMQDGAKNKDGVGQTTSEDAKESEHRRKLVEYAQSEDEMIINFQTNTTDTTEILPEDDFSSEDDNLDSLVDMLLESAGRQEVQRNLEKTPKGLSEERGVALKEQNIPACEETQEGVPVNNNELSLDENTTQLFLEGDSKEAEAARLPEEVESNYHQERLQNTDQDHLPLCKAVEENQDYTEDKGNVGDSLSYTKIQPVHASFQAVIQDPGLFNQEEEKESLESSMKKEIRCYSSDLGVVVALKNKIIDTPELQDAMDEAEPNIEPLNAPNDENGATSEITGKSAEEFCERVDKLLKFGEENMTETYFLEEFVGNDKNQNTFKPESEIALQLQTQEESSRAPEIKALDVMNVTEERKTDTSEAGMSTEETDKHVIQSLISLTGENSHSISGNQDVIDEEILDLWLETVTPSKESISMEVSEVKTHKVARPHLLEGIEAVSYIESKVQQPEVDFLHQEKSLAQRRTEEEWARSAETSTESISKEVSEVETPKEVWPHLLEGTKAVSYTESKVQQPAVDYLHQEKSLAQRTTEEEWARSAETSTESISKEVSEVETPKEVWSHLLEGIEAVTYTESKVQQPEVDYLHQEDHLAQRRTAESAENEHGFQKHFDAVRMNTDIILPVNTAPLIPVDMLKVKDVQENVCSFMEKPKHAEAEQSRNVRKDCLEEQYDVEPCTEKLAFQTSSQKEQQPEHSEDFQELMPTGFEFADVITVAEDTDERKLDASEAIMSTEGTDKHVIQSLGSLTGENSHSISGSQDVIDEEILDLWLEAVTPAIESISEEVSEVETPKGAGPHLLDGIEAGSYTESKVRPPGEDYLHQENLVQRRTEEEWAESAETESRFQEHFDAGRMNTDIMLPVNTAPLIPVNMLKVKDLQENLCSFLEKQKHAEAEESRDGTKDLQEERYNEEPCTEKLTFQASSQKEQQPEHSEELMMPTRFEFAEVPTTKGKGQDQVDSYLLDLSLQKCRITVKNPRVRPPTNPRTLLHTPSMAPTPSSQAVPLGAVSIGIKLPGLGASLPVLKKSGKVTGKEKGQKTLQKEDKETKPEDNSDSPKQDEAQHKPRWMPPKHQGFGNPLMLELKTKLKRTVNE
ncbi:uncharacterized protein LOC114482052 isoform X2 [Gouania willdenowi]|uniref:uncharacterized protein LOC114482052 isoform X2 n=1 Tax=Gouania willdenowi TaxID=441366 RepID=UPI0010556A4A|nr:uncharacterized protein LOC114482052 isoform X2 [Gouania willdenowi]